MFVNQKNFDYNLVFVIKYKKIKIFLKFKIKEFKFMKNFNNIDEFFFQYKFVDWLVLFDFILRLFVIEIMSSKLLEKFRV